MTGQVEFNSHMDAVVAVAVALVNAGTPGEARGRPYQVPTDGAELHATLEQALTRRSRHLRTEDVDGLVALAGELRAVFEAVHDGDLDAAAGAVNELLTTSGAHPQLNRHDGEPWHLHFHGSAASPVSGWTASCATGLAVVLGSEYADRLGVCSAPGCDRVYVDTSRNGTRRFCSTTCQSRVKAAAYRRRQHV